MLGAPPFKDYLTVSWEDYRNLVDISSEPVVKPLQVLLLLLAGQLGHCRQLGQVVQAATGLTLVNLRAFYKMDIAKVWVPDLMRDWLTRVKEYIGDLLIGQCTVHWPDAWLGGPCAGWPGLMSTCVTVQYTDLMHNLVDNVLGDQG